VRGDGGPDRVGNRHVRQVPADRAGHFRLGQPGHVETGGGERSRRRGAHEKSRRRRGGF
jgi:hypothetical protein